MLKWSGHIGRLEERSSTGNNLYVKKIIGLAGEILKCKVITAYGLPVT
jgi:hypothetical protein